MQMFCLICEAAREFAEPGAPCPECGSCMAGLEDVGERLPTYESLAAREILHWLNQPPGGITSAVNKLIGSLVGVAKAVVPDKIAEDASDCVVGLLDLLQDASFYMWTADEQTLRETLERRFGAGPLARALAKVLPLISGRGLVQQAAELGLDVHSIADLRRLQLEQTDRLVELSAGVLGNRALALAEGALTGVGGFALLALDIPVLAAINFRYVQQIASCFGYDQDSIEEKIFTMRVFLLAFGGDFGVSGGKNPKVAAAYELKSLAYALARQWTYNQMAEKSVLMGLMTWLKRTATRQLVKHVLKRKAAGAVPILGAGISAAINYAMTAYTGKVALYCYRYRKLLEDFRGLEGDDIPAPPV